MRAQLRSTLRNRFVGIGGLVFAIFFGCGSCSFSAFAQTPAPLVDEVVCPFGALAVEVDCITLRVPENRSDPDTRDITLFAAILRSSNPDAAPDPVLYLQGGPGEAATADIDLWIESPLLVERDIILLDQRGTGLSRPVLGCPEVESAQRLAFAPSDRSPADEIADVQAAAGACAERLRSEGIDLDGYRTGETAADVAALRAALGIETWNVYGISYGTRAVLAVMRDAPEGIRSAVLDSGSPPDELETRPSNLAADFAKGFEHLFTACASDDACADAYPDLASLLDAMVTRYDTDPFLTTVMFDGSAGLQPLELEVTGADLYGLFGVLLKEESFIPQIPGAIALLASGDTSQFDAVVVPVLVEGVLAPGASATGMGYSVDCADQPYEPDAADRALLADPGHTATLLLFASGTACPVWNVSPAAPSEREPVRSDVPTLLLAGSFDPISLPAQTRSLGATLTRATYVELSGSGHGPSISNECGMELTARFIANPLAPLDPTCAESQARPTWAGASG